MGDIFNQRIHRLWSQGECIMTLKSMFSTVLQTAHLYGPFLLKLLLYYYHQKNEIGPWHILSVQIIYIFT